MTSTQLMEEAPDSPPGPEVGPEIAQGPVGRARLLLFASRGVFYAAVGAMIGLAAAGIELLPAEWVFSWRGPLAVFAAAYLLDAVRVRRQSVYALTHSDEGIGVSILLENKEKNQKVNVNARVLLNSFGVTLAVFLALWLACGIFAATTACFALGAAYGGSAWLKFRSWEALLFSLAALTSGVLAWRAGTDPHALAVSAIPATAGLMLGGLFLHLRWRRWAAKIEKDGAE